MSDGPVTNILSNRRVIRNATILIIGVFAIITVIAGAWYLYSSMQETTQEETKQDLQNTAMLQADKLAEFFNSVASQLTALAKDPIIVSAFELGQAEVLLAQEQQQLKQFASALKLRLLIPGKYELDINTYPPLSFASLDLLRRAETSTGAIAADVLLFGTSDQHIVMVERVLNKAGELVGLLHISLELTLIENSLSGLSLPENAYLELWQSVAEKKIVLGTSGNVNIRSGEPVTKSVTGTRWTIAFWQGNAEVQLNAGESGSIGMETILMAVLLFLVFGGGLGFYFTRGIKIAKGKGKDSGIVYAGAVRAIMDGAHPGMEQLIPNLPGGTKNKLPSKPISQGMTGDDITMIMNTKDLENTVEKDEVVDITKPEEEKNQDTADATTAQQTSADTPQATSAAQENESAVSISSKIFRTYDIRGLVGKELTAETLYLIGQAIGSEAAARDEQTIIVGRDGRTSSPELSEALIKGMRASGRNVIDIGMLPTPVLYYATHTLEPNSGVMLTGSHNGPEYNGLKIVLAGETLSNEAIQAIRARLDENNLETGQGELETKDLTADYVRQISEDIPVALGGAFKIVVDCGNGVAGTLAPQLYRALGHDVIELFCEVDGKFPNHQPDPSQPENLEALIAKVKEEQADLGFAFDGDGDRLGVVDGAGNIIWPDRQMMLLAKDVLSRNKGAEIIFDVKCSRYLKAIIETNGGKPLMWKTGHSLIKAKMKESGAPLAGEMSGHIFFKERWFGFDDALYAGARLLEVLMAAKAKPVEVFSELPEGVSTPELRIALAEEAHESFMQNFGDNMSFEGADITDIDGYRVEFEDGWGLVRPSNTTPCLVVRFEADNNEALARIQSDFQKLLLSINPDLQLPF